MTATEDYINRLSELKSGELGLLRTLADKPLDEELRGFDLFTGLWWPLRQKSPRVPRREVAWLIAKLFAAKPMPQKAGSSLQQIMGQLRPPYSKSNSDRKRYTDRFDALLYAPIDTIEQDVRAALCLITDRYENPVLDWVQLTDDLSFWEKEETKKKWANSFLGNM